MYLLVFFNHISFFLAYSSNMIPKSVSERAIDGIAFSIGLLGAGISSALYCAFSNNGTILTPLAILMFFIVIRLTCHYLSTWLFGENFDDE